MSDHDVDAVIERVAWAIERTWCDCDDDADTSWADDVVRVNRIAEAGPALAALKPGDRLPGDCEVVSSEWLRERNKRLGNLEAGLSAMLKAASGD